MTTLLLLWAGCGQTEPPGYYDGVWSPPSVASVAPDAELGNVGGGVVVLTGEGFGSDRAGLVVVFGGNNADILAVADDRVEVRVPPGPLSAGSVDVKVATATGYTNVPGGYRYDAGDIAVNEAAYVQVNNFWESCYGGLSSRLDDAWPDLLGSTCQSLAYMGITGTTGVSEGLSFAYPRVHTSGIGFYGGGDLGAPAWVVSRPGSVLFPAAIADLHADVGEVVLHNAWWDDDKDWCADLGELAQYHYGGGGEGASAPVTVYGSGLVGGTESDACEEGDLYYDRSELHFCTGTDAAALPTHRYEADWPVPANFFAQRQRQITTSSVALELPELGIEPIPLELPEPLVLRALEGFEGTGDPAADEQLWSLLEFSRCFDDDGNGERLDDVALSFAWVPTEFEPSAGATVVGQATFVRFTLTQAAYGWLGVTGYPVRATVAVPDDHNYTSRQGYSRLDVPLSVMIQLASLRFPEPGLGSRYLDAAAGDMGFLVVTAERVTEYALDLQGRGDLVFSYATGDLGFYGWDNPVDNTACEDCEDGDGDGWTDAADPDCRDGGEERGLSAAECNDGRDNDADGRTDAEDPDCEDAETASESNCANDDDDDGDGRADSEDPECAAGVEEGASCDDGVDNDADGVTDEGDPECEELGQEVGAATSYACHNLEDDDGDGLVDALDPDCEDPRDPSEAQEGAEKDP